MNTREEIIKILASDEFEISESLQKDTTIRDLAGWDSFKHLTFLMQIEQLFNIELTPTEIEKVSTIEDMVKVIERK